MKSFTKTSLVLLLFVSTMAYSSMIPATTAAPDWLDGWDYRKAITITGSAGAGTDYQVLLNVIYDSDMQTDFDDVHFTDDDGITELDYWLEYYNPDAPTIELADYGELSDESSSPDYILTNVKDGSAFNETSATDIEIWFEIDTTNGFEGFSYAMYLYASSQTDCDLTFYNFSSGFFVKVDEPLPSSYDWMNGTIYDSDFWNTTHIAVQLGELSGTANFYWDYGEITHSKTARFWVEVQDDLDSGQTIYMYYGNDAVSTTSDGDATFLFFDDFEDQDFTEWYEAGAYWSTQSSIVKRGTYAAYGDAGLDADSRKLFANLSAFGNNDFMVHMWGRSALETSRDYYFRSTDTDAGNVIALYADGSNDFKYDNGPISEWEFDTAVNDTWIELEIAMDFTNELYRFWRDGVYVDAQDLEDVDGADVTYTDNWEFYTDTDAGEDMWLDDTYVRKWILVEPEATILSGVETAPTVAWFPVGEAELIFPIGWDPTFQFGYDMFFIALGLIMIPVSTLYLVRGGRKEMSRDKLFYGLIMLVIGLGLLIGGVMP